MTVQPTAQQVIAAPSFAIPGSSPAPAVAPVYVDGIPVQLAVPPVTPRGRQDRHQRFWSSQPRPVSSNLQENYYASLGSPKNINYISFDLAHFPHTVALYWLNSAGRWMPVTWETGMAVSVTINGSVPAIVNSRAALAAGLNPYHYGAGHWVHFEEDITPITTTQLLFTMTRAGGLSLPLWIPPVDGAGHPCPYPLAIRDLDFGWEVKDRDDVPWTPRHPVVATERLPFDKTTDAHGSPMIVSVRENRASDLLAGKPWRCAPQLRSDSVVNLYVDARTASGAPQVIDRFFIDPVTSGVRVNLYYAAQGPPAGSVFQSADAPVIPPNIAVGGKQPPATTPTGLLFPNTPTFLTINANAAGISGSNPWWAALVIQPQFPSTDPGSYLIADGSFFQVYFSGGSFTAVSSAGTVIGTWTVTFAAGDSIALAAIFDGVSFHAWVARGDQPKAPGWGQLYALAAQALPPVSQISLGGPLPATASLQLISNPSFATGSLFGWAPFNCTLTTVNNAPPGGPQPWSVFLVPNGTSPFGAIEGSLPAFEFTAVPGTQYTVGVWIYAVNNSFGSVEVGFDWVDVNHIYLITTTQITAPVIGQWTFYQVSFNAPTGIGVAFGYPRAGYNTQGGGNAPVSGTMYIQQIQVTGPSKFASMNGNYNLRAMVIKQEQLDMSRGVPATVLSFASDPDDYVYPVSGPTAGDTTQNAAVRFHPNLVSGTVNPYGFAGGITNAYESCTWIPVLGDFTLARGFMEFDPVLAAVFKFEFTALRPEPFDYIRPITKHHKAITSGPATDTDHRTDDKHDIDTGVVINQNVAGTVQYSDSPFPNVPHLPGASLPREAIYATTPHGQESLTTRGGSLYNFQHWKPPKIIPRNARAAPHVYSESDHQVKSRIAYFVALTALGMYRSAYSAQDDSEEYTDFFGDLANTTAAPPPFPAMSWSWRPGVLTTPGGMTTWAQLQSAIFASDHTVTGVQFASTQTDPVQILADPNFAQPGIPQWQATGDAIPVVIAANINTQFGNMAQVSRNAQGAVTSVTGTVQVPLGVLYGWQDLTNNFQSWALMMPSIGTWSGFWHTVWTTQQYTQAIPAASYYGGITTISPVNVSGGGRIYAAARVFSPQALTQPLALQILDGATGTVLAEADNQIAGGVVAEWFTGYTLGSADLTQVLTWTQVAGNQPLWSSFGTQSWIQVDLSVQPLGQTVNIRLIQRGITSDTWYVDNISLFDQAITWSFSNDGGASFYPAYDIRNNPSGVLKFPAPQQGTGNQLVWRLQGWKPGLTVTSLIIRPWYTVYPRGVPPRVAGIGHGPNLTPQDYYSTLDKDPHWTAWSQPIPQSWFLAYQTLLHETGTYVPVAQPQAVSGGLVLGDGLVVTAASQVPPPPAPVAVRLDIYSDVYTDTFGIAAAGDLYTDVFDDVYGADYPVTTGTTRSGGAALSAGSQLTATATSVAGPTPLEGATVGTVPGNSLALTQHIAVTGIPLALRRLYLGNQIPPSVQASLAAYDATVPRKVFFDFRPDATTTVAQLDQFLASCAQAGMNADVSLWSNPQLAFTNPQDYSTILNAYVPVIRSNGFNHIFVMDNRYAIRSNGFGRFYPGDGLVDAIAAGFFCQGPMPGDPGADRLEHFATLADQHGQPFGLAEFGADWSRFTPAQGTQFLNYVLRFLQARIRAKKPVFDCIYLSAGTFALVDAPAAWVNVYKQIAALLAGSFGGVVH